MSDEALLAGLREQYTQALDLLDGVFGRFPADRWSAGGPPYTGPGRASAHALVCAEFYTCRERAALDHFQPPIWEMTDEQVPDQDTQKAYLAQVRAKTAAWFDRIAPTGLAATDDEGTTALEQIVYALRHLQHHTGEVFAYQKVCGIEVRGWE